MSSSGTGFKRVVVGLPQGPANQGAVAAAADLAEFLNIELLATFVADAALPALAGGSGARELRALEQEWQAIDRTQITRDIDRAVNVARQYFVEGVRSRRIKTRFDILSGAEAMAALIRADDIVVIIEPAHPGEHITLQFTGLLKAAFAMAGAVLIVPTRIARTTGPIVAVASTSEDPSIRAALEIAAAFGERLIIVTAAGILPPPLDVFADAEQLGVQIEQISGSVPVTDASSRTSVGRLRERLRVLSRGALTDDSARLFSSLQGIPLLVIEPDRAEVTAKQQIDRASSSGG
jgi:hypothetical protein